MFSLPSWFYFLIAFINMVTAAISIITGHSLVALFDTSFAIYFTFVGRYNKN